MSPHRVKEIRRTNIVLALSVLAVFLGMLMFALTAFYIVSERDKVNVRICASQITSRDALRLVLIRARDTSLNNTPDPGADQRIQRFYNTLLEQIPALECDSRGNPKERRAQ